MTCGRELAATSIKLATVTAALSFALAGCTGNAQETSDMSPTAFPTVSADASEPTSDPIKAASTKPANSATATPAPEIAEKTVVDQAADGYQRPAADANGYVGPSEEYYGYDGYVQPGFEYQVGSECFDPALGRCKSSGEIQSEWIEMQASKDDQA